MEISHTKPIFSIYGPLLHGPILDFPSFWCATFLIRVLRMGAEESRMYPGHEGSSTSHQGQSAGTRATYAGTRQQTVQRNPPTILPQPVLLVGYTPEGAPILMSNTAQNTVSQMTTHSTSTHAPVFDQQSAVAPSLTTGTVAVTGPPQASHMTNEMMTNLLQTQTPVLAVPVTILGPDGKPVTALVKPTSNQRTLGFLPSFHSRLLQFLPLSSCLEMRYNRNWSTSYRARYHLYWRHLPTRKRAQRNHRETCLP